MLYSAKHALCESCCARECRAAGPQYSFPALYSALFCQSAPMDLAENSNLSLTDFQTDDLKDASLLTVVALCCVLSMLGSLLIIFSYVFITEIRTTSRAILVHLSIADFGVACANFIGATVYFHGYLKLNNCEQMPDNSMCFVINGFCTAQAFFAGYFTLASVLWTLGLAVYIYTLVATVYSTLPIHVARFLFFFCWGMPLFIAVWLLQTDRLGYSPHGGAGWCSLKFASERQEEQIFVVVFGNDLWIYTAFFMITILYLSSHYHILRTVSFCRYYIQALFYLQRLWPHALCTTGCLRGPSASIKKMQIKLVGAMHLNESSMSAILRAEQKFLVIPFAFLLLRIGSVMVVAVYVYLGEQPSKRYSTALHYIAVSAPPPPPPSLPLACGKACTCGLELGH